MRALVGFFGMIMLIGLTIKLIRWILGAVVLYGLFRVGCAQLRSAQAARAAKARRAAQISARADKRHRWVLRGDDRGIYGVYPVDRAVQ
jgi:hypothetical protein